MSVTSTRTLVAFIALGLVLVLAGQLATGVLMPAEDGSAAQAIGRAGFSYLTGVRTFAAAIVWNRLEPIFHEYYGDVPLAEQVNALPMIRIVNWLDPQFEDGYYISAWILSQRGDTDQALEIAEAGVEANPDSGLLRASYAQILYVNGDTPRALSQAEMAFKAPDWRDEIEKHDSFGVLKSIFRAAGDSVMQERTEMEIEHLDEIIGDQLPAGSHDHDGDGEPDH